jgi:hypothetical protein
VTFTLRGDALRDCPHARLVSPLPKAGRAPGAPRELLLPSPAAFPCTH